MQNRLNQQQFVDMNNNATSSLSIVERTKLWSEYKEKKIREAQSEKEKSEQDKSECTFKPQINKNNNRRNPQGLNAENSQANNNKGLDKYLQRMDKAKEMKEDKQKLEDQLFKKTSTTWRPKLTTPQEPKLSAYINRNDRDGHHQQTIKALSKPVNIYGPSNQNDTASKYSNGYDDYGNEGGGSFVNELSPNNITKTKDFIQFANRCREQFVEIRSDMNYDEAVTLIHQHILDLDI